MNKIKLCIQNGHRNAPGGKTGTSGKTSQGVKFNEVDWIDSVYYKIKEKIDFDPRLSALIDLSYDDAVVKNGKTADYFVAIHGDGSTNPNYNGGFVDDSPDDLVASQSWKFAQRVADEYFSKIGIRFAPEHRTPNSTYYYAFLETGGDTKQFLIECGAMTNVADMDKMADIPYIAHLLLTGITSYFQENEPIFKDYEPALEQPTMGDEKDKEIKELEQRITALQTEKASEIAKVKADCQEKLQDIKNKIQNYINSI